MKECTKCGQSKELVDFEKRKSSPDGRTGVCKKCKAKGRQLNYIATPRVRYGSARDAYLRRTYGITQVEEQALHADQLGCCKICGIEEKYTSGQKLCVDHDHDSGAVRGLLCSKCNAAIGLLQDSSEFTIKATTYLQDNGK